MPSRAVPEPTTAPDAALVARFRGDVAHVFGRTPAPDERIALAVSGGPDSMAMLALATKAYAGGVIAATVDHRTRTATADEAALVAGWCTQTGVPHATLPLAAPLHGSALHERARVQRYEALARWAIGANAACLLTAHHADDQAETFLMRAVRGAGAAGLAGIRARRSLAVRNHVPGVPRAGVVAVCDEWTIPLLRPLLGWRRAELRALAERIALPFVDDPSNTDDRFERSRVRKVLADNPWLDSARLARSAAHVGEAHAALDAMEAWLWRTRQATPAGTDNPADERWLDLTGLPRELVRRLARSAIADVKVVNGIMPDFDMAANIEPLLDAVEGGRSATQAGILVSRSDDIWRFREAPPRRPARRSV